MQSSHHPKAPARFDIGVNGRVPVKDAVLMGLQNVFVMTGIFVFPGIMGKTLHLPLDTVAYLYAVTFMGCGLTTLLIGTVFGRMPLVAGPYAGIFTALMIFARGPGGLGSAFGSLAAASLLWAALSIPIRGFSPVGWLSRAIRTPVISGVIVMLVMLQIADLAFPHWLGKPEDPSFGLLNLGAGLLTALVLMLLICTRHPMARRLALLISLVAGTAFFEAFSPVNFAAVAHAPWVVTPKLFPFGLGFDPMSCLVYFVILVAVNLQTMALMGVVAEWTDEAMSPPRLSGGVLAMMLGSAVGACFGSFTNLPYPANVAILRSTGVASRWVTAATGVILIAIGFCTKIDYVFVLLPVPVLAAAATVLFGIVFVHGVEMLAKVDWDERALAIGGFSLMLGFGSLFLEPKTLAAMPPFVSLLLRQPIIVGVSSLLLLSAILPGGRRVARNTAVLLEAGAGAPEHAAGE